jgi:hypothetical protein
VAFFSPGREPHRRAPRLRPGTISRMDSLTNEAAAKRCASDWHVAKDAHDGSYYCAPNHPEAATGQALGQFLAIPAVIVLTVLVRGVRRRRARSGR